MERANAATFGRRRQVPVRPISQVADGKSRWLVIGLIAAVVAFAGTGLLYIYPSASKSNAPTGGDLSIVSSFPLSGTWATDDKSCAEAPVKVELDGSTMTSVSLLGRIPIGNYSVSGTNPLVLTFDGGDQVVWDTSDPGRLIPISVTPDKDGRMERMILIRC
jgi:hypothetical protein